MTDYLSLDARRVTDSIAAARADKRTAKAMLKSEKLGNLTTLKERGIQAGILNNFSRAIQDSIDAPATRGQQVNMMSDFGPYIPEVFPIVAAWYPDFPLKDLISVQDMNQDLAYLFFSKLVTGTNKAPTITGQVVETAMGMRQINGYYPTGEIMGETIPEEQLDYDATTNELVAMTAYYALNTSGDYLEKFLINVYKDNAIVATLIATTVQNGKVMLVNSANPGVSNGSYMVVESGAIMLASADINDLQATTGICLNVNYVWNLDYAIQENIPKVKEQVERVEMRAIPRAIGMEWTIFAEALKKSQFNTDIRVENTKRVLDLLYQYQVRYILDTMWTYAAGAPGTITLNMSNNFSLDVQAADLMRQLKQYATQIEIATGRIEGNRLVVGKNLKSFLESLPTTWFKPVATPSGFSSPREIGTFGTFKVYYDPYRADNEAFMTYRGTEWYDAAFYMGIFLPIVPTDTVALGVTVRQSMVSMEAYCFNKKTAVVKLTVNYGA